MPEQGRSKEWVSVPAQDWGEAIVASMTEAQIEYLFFTSGSELCFYQEAIAKARAQGRRAPRLITVPHEHVSLNAALGYAAVSGKAAVTAVHVDVGTLHHGAAIHTAWRSGLPVVMTAGAPPTAYPGSMRGARDSAHLWIQQSADQEGIVRVYTKWQHRLASQDNPGLIMSRALQVAQSEPCGPVYLTLPREIVFLPSETASFPTVDQLSLGSYGSLDPEAANEIAQRLLRASNPMIVAGTGRAPSTVPALVGLCELLGIPAVHAAWKAYQCFPMDHPLYQERLSLAEADAVLVLEADVPWVPGPDAPSTDAFVAVIDHDPIKSKIPVYEFTADMRVTADPLSAIRAIMDAAQRMISPDYHVRIRERTKRWTAVSADRSLSLEREAQAVADQHPIDPRWLAYQIAKLGTDNSIVMDDTVLNRLSPYLRLSRPGSYFHNPGSAGGWAPGAALGAKLAAPERDVIAATGDGYYMFGNGSAALWTAARHGAPFLTVVFQNRSYSTGTISVAAAYRDGYSAKSGFEGGYVDPPIDFARQAEAAGAYGENVDSASDIEPALHRGLEQTRSGKPAVISVWLPRLLQED